MELVTEINVYGSALVKVFMLGKAAKQPKCWFYISQYKRCNDTQNIILSIQRSIKPWEVA